MKAGLGDGDKGATPVKEDVMKRKASEEEVKSQEKKLKGSPAK